MKKLLKKLFCNFSCCQSKHERKEKKKIAEWEKAGKPVPPPNIIKQQAVEYYGKQFGLKVLVETGTYHGDMVDAMKNNFDTIYSIELSDELYERAKNRFKADSHIEIIHGDSGVEIKNVLDKIDQSTLFWLDGHYSAGETARGEKDTPICEELEHILAAPDRGHVIIIDDARCFGKDSNYPSIDELSKLILSKRPGVDILVKDDSMRVTPKL